MLASSVRLHVVRVVAALFVLSLSLGARAGADPAGERAASAYLDGIRSTPLALRRFMQELPKGADLHNHASGAVYAERLIDYAVTDGLCADAAYALTPCQSFAQGGSTAQPLATALQQNGYRDRLINALSMRFFVPGEESGHDHFFNAFGKFGPATWKHGPEIVAEAVRQAAEDHVDYLELMTTFGNGPAWTALTKGVAYDADFDKLRAALTANGRFAKAVDEAAHDLQTLETQRNAALHCAGGSGPRSAACDVQLRYIEQVSRNSDRVTVFARTMLGFALARRDERLVAVNFVSPEDGAVSVRDYALHMRMIAYLRRTVSDVPVTLHAGELTLGLVPRAVLDDHIDLAVNVAGARRIGHGVDVVYERNEPALLATMAARPVLVEIALTSNDVILGVRGAEHPVTLYLQAGVPIALVTDDEGVSRIDLSNEFVRAARDYAFSYATLKRFVRNSLEYGFIKGKSLWDDEAAGRPVAACSALPATDACRQYLAANPRASMQWKLERELDAFETSVVAAQGPRR
jgi:adenosine deaminase